MIKNVFIFTLLQIYVRGKKYDLRRGMVKKYDFQCNIPVYCRPLATNICSFTRLISVHCFFSSGTIYNPREWDYGSPLVQDGVVGVNREHLSAPDSLANLFCYQVTFCLSNPLTRVADLVTVVSASFGGSVAELVLFWPAPNFPPALGPKFICHWTRKL